MHLQVADRVNLIINGTVNKSRISVADGMSGSALIRFDPQEGPQSDTESRLAFAILLEHRGNRPLPLQASEGRI